MYLKEAFRYQNFLSRMVDRTTMYLGNRNYITKTTQEHLRKKANHEAEDETVEVVVDRPFDCTNNQLVSFLAGVLADMSKARPSESVIRGTAYKFNGEGNQVPYNYDVKQVTTIDFDRNKVRDASRAMVAKSDEVSTSIDKLMVELVVEYEPEYSVNDSFEDIVAQFIEAAHPAE